MSATPSRRFLRSVVLTVLLTGCNSSPPNEYRVIDQRAGQSATSAPIALETGSSTGTIAVAADAMQVENAVMLSVHPEASKLDTDLPVSALEIANSLKIELLVPTMTFQKDRITGALKLTFDDLNLLKVLNMDPVTDDAVSWMPEWMTSLGGKQVRIRGFMYPPFVADGLESFVLLRDNQKCCYGPGAKIYDHIEIRMKPGTTASYISLNQSFDVVGRFKIEPESNDGMPFGLYVIEDAAVIIR